MLFCDLIYKVLLHVAVTISDSNSPRHRSSPASMLGEPLENFGGGNVTSKPVGRHLDGILTRGSSCTPGLAVGKLARVTWSRELP